MLKIKSYSNKLINRIANWRLLKLPLYTVFSTICLLVLASYIYAIGTPIPPPPTQWVTDNSNFISSQAAQELNIKLEKYHRATGHQVLVYIDKTTGSVPIADWGVKAFETWKVGNKGIDDGLVLFIMTDDHQLRIEVGYGLEGQVTDAMASRIIREVIVPKIQAGEHDRAVIDGVNSIVSSIGDQGFSESPPKQLTKPETLSIWQYIGIGIAVILFLALLVTHPSLAMFLIFNILSGGRGGSNDEMGGGFRGGGGRSGGGGASGSW